MNIVHLGDCLPAMREMEDNAFDLAVVDPPYGIGEDGRKSGTRLRPTKKWANPRNIHKAKSWDVKPGNEYFRELERVTTNRIVWGGNHFTQYLIPSSCWIYWNKKTSGDFSYGELAWTSYTKGIRQFDWLWSGFKQERGVEKRIHPTQKPVDLYKWIYANYAKPGHKILDTHVGSGSSRIAAWDAGLDFIGYEIDKDYWEAQEARFQEHIKQTELWPQDETFRRAAGES